MHSECRPTKTAEVIFGAMFEVTGKKRREIGTAIIERLTANGHRALFAGGYVRDMLLSTPDSGDIDIATDAVPARISELFSQVFGVGEHFGVMIVVEDKVPFEVATFRSDIGIKDGRHPESVRFSDEREDAVRRDFTINGLFYDPLTDEIFDYVDGRQDLEHGIIRAIGNPEARFREDYLRMLRAVRFAANLNFSIESDTWEALCRYPERITEVSRERIFQELNKMLLGDHADRAVKLLQSSGMLVHILPEVAVLQGVAQPPEFHPEGDVFDHTMLVLRKLDRQTQTVRWAALLHDIGKPGTMKIEDRIRFNGHDREGAAMARAILRRLRAPRSLIDTVSDCISNHMNFMNVRKMRLSTLKRFLARETIEDEIALHRADCLASHGDISNVEFLRGEQGRFVENTIKPAPLLTGKDLIDMGLKPGPSFGIILTEAYDRQLEDQFHTKEDAVAWVRENLGKNLNSGE